MSIPTELQQLRKIQAFSQTAKKIYIRTQDTPPLGETAPRTPRPYFYVLGPRSFMDVLDQFQVLQLSAWISSTVSQVISDSSNPIHSTCTIQPSLSAPKYIARITTIWKSLIAWWRHLTCPLWCIASCQLLAHPYHMHRRTLLGDGALRIVRMLLFCRRQNPPVSCSGAF